MASETLKVDTPSVGTGDTLASYNVYTDKPSAKTSIGTMTPAEASSGKAFTLADGLNHNVTVYPVGSTTGEFNAPSNILDYDLSVASNSWNIDTATNKQTLNLVAEGNTFLAHYWHPTGLFYFTLNGQNDLLRKFSVSVAFDITSTVTKVQTSVKPTQFGNFPTGLMFNPSGTKFWVSTFTGGTIEQFSLATAWDITSTITHENTFTTTKTTGIINNCFNANGTKIFYVDYSLNNAVYEISLSVPYDMSSGTVTEENPFVALETLIAAGRQGHGVAVSPDGTKLYVSDLNKSIYQITLNTANSLNGATYSGKSFAIAGMTETPRQIIFSPSGDKLHVCDNAGIVIQYDWS